SVMKSVQVCPGVAPGGMRRVTGGAVADDADTKQDPRSDEWKATFDADPPRVQHATGGRVLRGIEDPADVFVQVGLPSAELVWSATACDDVGAPRPLTPAAGCLSL